ncbi:hypothetical protein [Streptomyces sp. cmx-4-7]|uniref:hypothetical protein n=1 Tax=Streptomyces sp. cmx-4-7 TaxID=2790939 RepID=UPI00397FD145
MAALQANFPNMTISLVGASSRGSVCITALTLTDLINQAPDVKGLHYLLIECESHTGPQPDLVKVEFGSPEGIGRLQAFEGWFRRIQEWDVRVTAQSASSQEADRLLVSTVSVLRGHQISATRALAVSIVPAASEIFGLAALASLAIFKSLPTDKIFALALVCIFYWRLAFFLKPPGAHIYLRPRSSSISGLLGWSPSPRAQAIWTVVGGFAGLIAFVVAVLAWLAPRN